jgi:Pyrimidine dimer DNA glycosylase
MNLFLLSSNVQECASFHCDKHVVKQITENLQTMVSALIRNGVDQQFLPKTKSGTTPKESHKNHPITRWVGDSYCNFLKSGEIGLALCAEYTKRYSKTHFCEAGIRYLRDNAKAIAPDLYSTKIAMTPYAIAIGSDSECRKLPFFEKLHTIDKYRMYYFFDKKDIATWKFTEKPYWFNQDYIDWLGDQYVEWKQEYMGIPT